MSRPLPVPMLDLAAQHRAIRDEIDEAVARVLDSQRFIGGPEVEALEEAVARLSGVRHAVACASGSDALLLSLEAAGVGPGDEVICPAFTFFATAGAVHRLGARAVFADVDPVSLNLDPQAAREAADGCRRLRAVMPVDLFGRVAALEPLLELAREHEAVLVEDAAQAIAARDARGAPAGSRGLAGCFSFFPSKNLGAFGDAGMITTGSDALAERLLALRSHGAGPDGLHRHVGTNSRLDALQAAVLRVKLGHLPAWTKRRAENAAFYDQRFAAADALPLSPPRREHAPALHVYNQYVVRVGDGLRDPLRDHLAAQGIETRIYYERGIHHEPCFAGLAARSTPPAMPATERACRETLALPVHPELSAEQREHVAASVLEFLARRAS